MAMRPLAFDLEVNRVGEERQITVAGLRGDAAAKLILNTDGRDANEEQLQNQLGDEYTTLSVHENEADLILELRQFIAESVNKDDQYLTGFNAEVWDGGHDLPILRRSCIRHSIEWVFRGMAYIDVQTLLKRIETGDTYDLAGAYDMLIGGFEDDPFHEAGGNTIRAHKHGDWLPLLQHNHADIVRTFNLARLLTRYVPKSDVKMKNLTPPER